MKAAAKDYLMITVGMIVVVHRSIFFHDSASYRTGKYERSCAGTDTVCAGYRFL